MLTKAYSNKTNVLTVLLESLDLFKFEWRQKAHIWVVSRGQTTISAQGITACSISAHAEKGMARSVWYYV